MLYPALVFLRSVNSLVIGVLMRLQADESF